jgi:hypothetical protein
VLAVLGLVVAFSFSSTLVKRAETPGVLVAFWRLATVSLVWNVVLWSTGRRVALRDVRKVWIPDIFFGLNLAVFFAGATHNSVANAALRVAAATLERIGSRPQFLRGLDAASCTEGARRYSCIKAPTWASVPSPEPHRWLS